MSRGKLFAQQAREWLGVPFRWGQASRAGCDCKGLIAGVAKELGFSEAESFYALIADYRSDRPVPSDVLERGMAETFDQVPKMRVGDILLCNYGGKPGHLAIYSGKGRSIHTQISSKAWVKETRLDVLHHYYPLHSIWRWRD